jgi:serine/threonine protein phosphatase 1
MTQGRIIAIGDIHGCSVAFRTLMNAIQPTPLDTLVLLGDYIDRGPDSRGVLDQVLQLTERCQVVPLLGNHEEMLLGALEGKDDLGFWLKFGGRDTLDSYGGDFKKVPAEHIRFIKRCRNYYETLGQFFVHAYYDPDRPLYEQLWNGMRWLSLPRCPLRHCSGKVAIVGHTAQTSGEILDMGFLKCIDTFCHGGGWLTALAVDTGQVWQANQEGVLRQSEPGWP